MAELFDFLGSETQGAQILRVIDSVQHPFARSVSHGLDVVLGGTSSALELGAESCLEEFDGFCATVSY